MFCAGGSGAFKSRSKAFFASVELESPKSESWSFFWRVEQLWWFEDAKSSTFSKKYGTHTKAIFLGEKKQHQSIWNKIDWTETGSKFVKQAAIISFPVASPNRNHGRQATTTCCAMDCGPALARGLVFSGTRWIGSIRGSHRSMESRPWQCFCFLAQKSQKIYESIYPPWKWKIAPANQQGTIVFQPSMFRCFLLLVSGEGTSAKSRWYNPKWIQLLLRALKCSNFKCWRVQATTCTQCTVHFSKLTQK